MEPSDSPKTDAAADQAAAELIAKSQVADINENGYQLPTPGGYQMSDDFGMGEMAAGASNESLAAVKNGLSGLLAAYLRFTWLTVSTSIS